MANTEMIALKKLGNSELLEQTHSLVKEERRIGIQILHRLKEISRRRFYSELGYSSLFTCLVQEFKYSEATAYRLLNAMKVVAEVPEVEEKVQSGELSVSTLSQVQSYCQAQKRENGLEIKLEEKKQILEAVEGCSKRETEKVLASLHPEQPLPISQETERVITPHQTEIKFVASDELLAKLNRIKDLTAHQKLNPSYAELFELMAEVVLNKIDPLRKAEKLKQKKEGAKEGEEPLAKGETLSSVKVHSNNVEDSTSDQPSGVKPRSRYIPVHIRRKVWVRAGGQCCYVNPESGQRCAEKRGLEVEHIIPFAKGGTHTLSNLELLCRGHNLYSAVKSFGSMMDQYLY